MREHARRTEVVTPMYTTLKSVIGRRTAWITRNVPIAGRIMENEVPILENIEYPQDLEDVLSSASVVDTTSVGVEIQSNNLVISLAQLPPLNAPSWLVLEREKKIVCAFLLDNAAVQRQFFAIDLRRAALALSLQHVKRVLLSIITCGVGEEPARYELVGKPHGTPSFEDRSCDYLASVSIAIDDLEPAPSYLHLEENAGSVQTGVAKGSQGAVAIVPFLAPSSRFLSLLLCWEDEVPSNQYFGILESIAFSRHGQVRISVKTRERSFRATGLELSYRSASEPFAYRLKSDRSEKDGWTYLTVSFDIGELSLREIYWDLYLDIEMNNTHYRLYVRCDKHQRRRFAMLCPHTQLENGLVFFPYDTAKLRRVAFMCRPSSRYDGMSYRLRGMAALLLAKPMRMLWKKRSIWLVYEKFCSLAEDNGYHFFRYCMDNLSSDENRDIYYVIDKKAPEYENVKKYGRHVIDFMSFQHLLYVQLARLYVGSDSSQHLYQWRPMPNVIQGKIRKHDMLFLQHGVIALKRVDKGFGASNSNPISYFLTSSAREQQIIAKYFGYSVSQVPILGLSRWDALEDRSDRSFPTILVMPTWRPWLEEQSSKVFEASDYFAAYSALLSNDRLMHLLEQYDTTLKFFIHPKMSEFISSFTATNRRVNFVAQGERPLNELIMECSLLVTDYSSVCWDVLHQDKPVVFFQFDQDAFLEYVGSYIDFDCDLPGAVCCTADATITAVEKILANGCKPEPQDLARAESWYAYRDNRNRERTYRFIKEQGY